MDLKQGDLENIILNALWDLEDHGEEKVFVSDVQDYIRSAKKRWAYTTVKTVLDRLVDKDLATREKEGKKYLYRSLVQRDSAGLLALKKVLKQYFRNDVSEMMATLADLKALMALEASENDTIPLLLGATEPDTVGPAAAASAYDRANGGPFGQTRATSPSTGVRGAMRFVRAPFEPSPAFASGNRGGGGSVPALAR
jgi:predicted transcriptional regulator